jgi:hypothetical protein
MNGEETGDEGAAPERAGHCSESQKKKQDREGMQNHIHGMVTAGVQAGPLRVEHERDGSEGMPVGDQRMSKSPNEPGPGQTIADKRVW